MIHKLKSVGRSAKRFLMQEKRVILHEDRINKENLINVTFTGGMGAQILSAAIYFDLQALGIPVKADMSYFSRVPHVAVPGNDKEISHWDWQLEQYGIMQDDFLSHFEDSATSTEYLLPDGALKLRLAMRALQKKEIRARFPLPPLEDCLEALPESSLSLASLPYICIHVRRGDYLNVASYLVPEEDFLLLCERFKSLVMAAVVVSDSSLTNEVKQKLQFIFPNLLVLDGAAASPFITHCVMRHSTILVCSNSQYSLTAGGLNEGLVLLPKEWIGKGHDELKVQLDKLSNFAVLN